MNATPRLIDVARAAGVSPATASRALSGTAPVATAKAERVLQAAASLGYVPNAHARALAGAATRMAGLIIHDVGDPYFSEIARGVVDVAERNGIQVLISHSRREPERELSRIRSLRANQVESLVLAGSGYVDPQSEAAAGDELGAFEASGGRVVLVGRHHIDVDAVVPDNVAGAATATRHLLELGHRDIAVLAGPPTLTTIEDRLAGVASALREYGLDADGTRVIHADFTREGGSEATATLVESDPSVTAILALNDAMATGALATLRERGIAVPAAISVMGFNDTPVAADTNPPLSTIRLPLQEMGSMALEMTLDPRSTRRRRRRTPHELVIRASTGPPPERVT